MSNYRCRTCLYTCEKDSAFRKLDNLQDLLQLIIPEIKSQISKTSLICEQCFYFLKNVEIFKNRCLEIQDKFVSITSAITILQVNVPQDVVQNTSSVLYDSPNDSQAGIRNDDLLQLLNSKTSKCDLEAEKNKCNFVDSNENIEIEIDSSDEDEYMSREDLISSGVILDDKDTISGDIEFIGICNSKNPVMKEIHPPNKYSSNKVPVISQVGENVADIVPKKELQENVSGSFYKRSQGGLYECRLCDKKYKRSKFLHRHLKKEHVNQLKCFYCDYCNFVCLWRSSLKRHNSIFHK